MSLVYVAFAMAAVGTVALVGCAYGLWKVCRDEKRQQRLDNWDIDPAELAQQIAKWTDELREEET